MVEKLIIASLQDFFDLECIGETKSETKRKLVFPIKRDGKRRVIAVQYQILLENIKLQLKMWRKNTKHIFLV